MLLSNDKYAAGSWKKYCDEQWNEPGAGGKESGLVPVSVSASGYTPADKEYDRKQQRHIDAQIKAGTLQKASGLVIMGVAWNAYLGQWLGETQGQAMYHPPRSNTTSLHHSDGNP